MSNNTAYTNTSKQGKTNLPAAGPASVVGEAFLTALADQDFDALQSMFAPNIRFRAMVPSGIREGKSAQEAAGWLKRWFGSADELEVLQAESSQVFDRLYLTYRVHLHDDDNGWRYIEQHAYSNVKSGLIDDMWLVCSGFRPDSQNTDNTPAMLCQLPQPHFAADSFYSAGSLGCAEGPMEEIAGKLRKMNSGQTLEIYATDPSVAGDLAAWCRLSGNEFVKHEGFYFLIQRT